MIYQMNQGLLCKWDLAGVVGRERGNVFRNEMRISYVAIDLTWIAIVAFSIESGTRVLTLGSTGDWAKVAELVVGRSLLGFFLFSGLIYQLTRLGYLKRFSMHRAMPVAELEHVYRGNAPSLAILVPSYMEEPRVVRQTLLAAALQQSPNLRVVLLIDDPPVRRTREDAAKLATTRNLPHEINALFAVPSRKFDQALADFIIVLDADSLILPEYSLHLMHFAYSTTPPDFGSLLIQRRRWATGGLIILPNVFRYVFDRPSLSRLVEGLIRAQYILSAPLGSIGALVLTLYPFEPDTTWSTWPLLAFLPTCWRSNAISCTTAIEQWTCSAPWR